MHLQRKKLIYVIARITGVLLFTASAMVASAQQVNFDSLINRIESEGPVTKKEGYTNLVRIFYLKFPAGFEKTLEWIESNKKKYGGSNDKNLEAWNKAFLAVLQEHTGEPNDALRNLNSVLRTADKNQNEELQGYALLNLGNLYSHSGKYDSAHQYFLKAKEKLNSKSPYFQFLYKFNSITFYTEWNQVDSAAAELKRLKGILEIPSMAFYRIHFQYLSLITEMNRVMLSQTNEGINKVLSQTNPNSILYLLALQAKSSISYRSGDFPDFIKSYSQKLIDFSLIDKLGLYNRAKLFLGLAEGYDTQGQHDLAFQYVNRAMKSALKGGYQLLLGKCHLELAWLSFALNDLTGAEQELSLADEIFKKINERYAQTDALNLLAQIRQRQDRIEEAGRLHEQCLDLRLKLGDPFLISSSLFNLGRIKSNKQQYTEALDYFRRGLKLDFIRGDNYGVSQYQLEMANAFRNLNRMDSALVYLQRAANLASTTGNAEVLKSCYSILAEIFDKTGDLKKAVVYLRKYNQIQDQLIQGESKTSLEAYKTLVELNNKEAELKQISKIQSQQEELFKTQQILLYISIAGVIVAIVVVLFYVRVGRKMRELSTINAERADLLGSQNIALESALFNLKKVQNQLIISEKMASLGIMSMGVAHELNNPMNFIRGGIMGLKGELANPTSDPELVKKFLGVIDEGVQRSSRIIQGLGHYSHTSESMDEDCDVHLIIENCLSIIGSKLNGRIDIERKFVSGSMMLKGNSGKFHQAILNLLVNAEQAIEGRGKIILTTRLIEGKKVVVIEDTGCGISEENQKRLGDLFFTTKEPGKGTGFGLSLCYKVIRDMGGVIEVDSTVGKGTSFILTF